MGRWIYLFNFKDDVFPYLANLSDEGTPCLVVAGHGNEREAHLVGPSVHDLFDSRREDNVFQISLSL